MGKTNWCVERKGLDRVLIWDKVNFRSATGSATWVSFEQSPQPSTGQVVCESGELWTCGEVVALCMCAQRCSVPFCVRG